MRMCATAPALNTAAVMLQQPKVATALDVAMLSSLHAAGSLHIVLGRGICALLGRHMIVVVCNWQLQMSPMHVAHEVRDSKQTTV